MKGFSKGPKKSTFTKKVDSKMGKGFCTAVKMQTFNPILIVRVVGAAGKEAIKTIRFQGVNGPMRTDKKYDYQKKCGMYIALFGQMVRPITMDEEALDRLTGETLHQMVDDGMFFNLSYWQFINQMRTLFLMIPELEEDDIDVYLEDANVQKDLQALWVA